MSPIQDIFIEGKIVSFNDGEKKINKGFTYGYRSLRVKSNDNFYSVLVNTSKFTDYGYIPKVGDWVRVEGKIFPSKEYEPSIKHLKSITHIEPPIVEQIMAKLRKNRL